MPLAKGIEDFDAGRTAPDVTALDFANLLAHKDAILGIYRGDPSFLTRPYAVATGHGGALRCAPAQANALFAKLIEAEVPWMAFQVDRYFPEWSDVTFRSEAGEPALVVLADRRKDRTFWDGRNPLAYGLIDLTLYFVHLLNIYVPNAPVLKNVYAVNVHEDAIGRQNESHARAAVEKVVQRFLPASGDDGALRLRDLVRLIKADLLRPAPRLNRGLAFEQECMNRLSAAGFEVRATPASGDFGADIIAQKDDLSYAIQCKDTSKPVGVKAVQEAIGARTHYKLDFAVVCAVAGFTDAAVELAASAKVIICNAEQLARRLDAV
ncbi:restriction endonuclease [Sphingomonas oryzagri]|uniref:Restriction endonuclease n=1 Tax=Sphingomonas oryzagri TaxID=3042314 RepID=A0ABT6N3U9_9SPHN|nr:restriction endonuclease [Sphingomonas oryzagri]MDH7639970.1 restriction endonuclease [Sphingomonas oryzagri]